MLSNWSDSPPESVVARPTSGGEVSAAANPPRTSYVPPHLRNPQQSSSMLSEASQAQHQAPSRVIQTGRIPRGSILGEPQGETRHHSVLGARPRLPYAGAGNRPWPSADAGAIARRGDRFGADANSRRGGRIPPIDRRVRREREVEPFLKDETSEAMFGQENTGINFDAYDDIPVETSGGNVPPPVNTFREINLGPALNANIQRCKYVKPTPVQKHAIPISLAGRDLMACAQTGSGKTAAFCFPIIAGLLHNPPHGRPSGGSKAYPLALILSPTRELSCQIHDEAKKFAYQTGIRVVVAYGGAPVNHQLRELERGVDILVATPGRLSDLLERARLSLSMVMYLALDEADRMLDMGFEPQIRRIVEQTDMPPIGERQTMLFSATFPKEIQRLAADFMYNYIFLAVGRVGSSTDLIVQKVENVNGSDKRSVLMDLIHSQNCNGFQSQQPLTLVFVETKRGADALEDWLCHMGFPATTIHGDRTQSEREHALRSFRTGMTPILVATDVAARGLDIPHVAHVVNFDLPNDIDDYVHRIGRTGRAGKTGLATALFADKDMPLARSLAELMQESNQEVPDWLLTYASRGSYGGRGRSRRSGGGSRFGGKDYRRDSNKGGANRSGGGFGGHTGGYGGPGGYSGGYGSSGGYSRGYGGSAGYSGGYGGSSGYGGGSSGDYGGSASFDGDYRSSNGYSATSHPWV